MKVFLRRKDGKEFLPKAFSIHSFVTNIPSASFDRPLGLSDACSVCEEKNLKYEE